MEVETIRPGPMPLSSLLKPLLMAGCTRSQKADTQTQASSAGRIAEPEGHLQSPLAGQSKWANAEGARIERINSPKRTHSLARASQQPFPWQPSVSPPPLLVLAVAATRSLGRATLFIKSATI